MKLLKGIKIEVKVWFLSKIPFSLSVPKFLSIVGSFITKGFEMQKEMNSFSLHIFRYLFYDCN
jgi:hypothetical protein